MKVLKHTLFVQFPQKKEWYVGRSNGGKATSATFVNPANQTLFPTQLLHNSATITGSLFDQYIDRCASRVKRSITKVVILIQAFPELKLRVRCFKMLKVAYFVLYKKRPFVSLDPKTLLR